VLGLLTTLKKIFFWNYARNTWQWDVLCVVILIFIFLTPKSWFSGSERSQAREHPNPIVKTVLVSAEVVGNEQDKGRIERQVQLMTGRDQFEIVAVRKVLANDGRLVSFEVDIR